MRLKSLKNIFTKINALPKKILIPLGLLLILVIISTLAKLPFKKTTPQVIKTAPNNQEKNVALNLSQITITFNKPLESLGEISINTLPIINFSPKLSNDKKTLTLSLSEKLLEKTQYVIEVNHQEKGLIYSFVFKTLKLDTKGFGAPNFLDYLNQQTEENYPLFDYTPFTSDLFDIDYLGPKKLGVVIKTASPSAARPLVEQWIKQRGVSPETHEIVFISE